MADDKDSIEFMIRTLYQGEGAEQARKNLQELQSTTSKTSKELQIYSKKAGDSIRGIADASMQSSGIIAPKTRFITGTFTEISRGADGITRSTNTAMDGINKISYTTTRAVKDNSTQFKMYWLGIMFFGMQLKRLAEGIMMDTLSIFTSIAKEQSSASVAVSNLSANITYLKFTVGEAIATALEPLIPRIIEIVQNISDWIEQNPTLVSGILLFASILGTAMFLAGTFGLIINSVTMLLETLGIVGAASGTAVGAGGATATAGWIGAALPIVAIGLAIAALFLLWDTNVGGIKSITLNVATVIMGAIKGIIETIVGLITIIFDLLGAYNVAFKGIVAIVFSAVEIATKLIEGFVNAIIDAINTAQSIVTLGKAKPFEHVDFSSGISKMAGTTAAEAIDAASQLYEKITGDIGAMHTNLQKVADEVKEQTSINNAIPLGVAPPNSISGGILDLVNSLTGAKETGITPAGSSGSVLTTNTNMNNQFVFNGNAPEDAAAYGGRVATAFNEEMKRHGNLTNEHSI